MSIHKPQKNFDVLKNKLITWCGFSLAEILGGILTGSSFSSLATFTMKPSITSPSIWTLAFSKILPLQVIAFLDHDFPCNDLRWSCRFYQRKTVSSSSSAATQILEHRFMPHKMLIKINGSKMQANARNNYKYECKNLKTNSKNTFSIAIFLFVSSPSSVSSRILLIFLFLLFLKFLLLNHENGHSWGNKIEMFEQAWNKLTKRLIVSFSLTSHRCTLT